MVVELMSKKKHLSKKYLTTEGLRKIIAIRASMNLGLSNVLKTAFPDITPVARPQVELPKNINPHWLAGFTEGCFQCAIVQNTKYKLGSQTQLRFSISQYKRDRALLDLISKYFNCGRFQNSRDAVEFTIVKLSDILDKIIPLFRAHTLQGFKALDFKDFSKSQNCWIRRHIWLLKD